MSADAAPVFTKASGTLGASPIKSGLFFASAPIGTCVLDAAGVEPIDPDGVDLSYLASGRAPILADHLTWLDNVLGVVADAWIEDGSIAMLLRFAPTGRGAEVEQLVRAGILGSVSLGAKCALPDAQGVIAAYRPYEVSVVSLPASWHARVTGPATGERLDRLLDQVGQAAERRAASIVEWVTRAAPRVAERLGVPADLAEAALREVADNEIATQRAAAVSAKRLELTAG